MQGNRFSRRRFIKNSSGNLAFLGLGAFGFSCRTEKKATVLAIVGDRYHNSHYIRTALSKIFIEEESISIDFTDEVKAINKENLKGYKILLIFRDGNTWPNGYGSSAWWNGYQVRAEKRNTFEIIDSSWYPGYQTINNLPIISDPEMPDYEPVRGTWMTEKQGNVVKDFILAGGSGLFYHNAGFIANGNDDFREVLGATAKGHPPMRPYKLEITDINHSITKGIKDFVVTDEQHFVDYQIDPEYVFMRSVNTDGLTHELENMGNSCQAGWAREIGNGRMCFLMPGHTIDVLWNPEYKKLQKNAMNWLLKRI